MAFLSSLMSLCSRRSFSPQRKICRSRPGVGDIPQTGSAQCIVVLGKSSFFA
ncbi:uncharacterized protein MYCFIDRAFT_182206 [Pseudocercospora fijiensis CIRAD86]|uniref:Uncharacterized protein n=1 Tax=Pseudocercospora fijiensis (strain CIRAD86) TaxID=383855 RepID=M2Z2A3_PSEFD|nr:uncharacterized protein MYCFIDRAFT_182206 [Pseudocercospora fijiensis CIRAD86]EME83960.1 hypothetical protein MYCFIDRAFT_182206 [Pseudocercospora fijiensis CIRAD86]